MVSMLPRIPGADEFGAPQPSSVGEALAIIGAQPPPQQPAPEPMRPTPADDWSAAARRIAVENGLDPNLYDAQIRQESGYDPDVIYGRRSSSAGAQGIAQFMPETARSLGVNPLDPLKALDAGAKYLKQQIEYFGGDYRKGLAAYNAGAGNVERAIREGGDNWEQFLPGETQTYLARITGGGAVAPMGTPAAPSIAGAMATIGVDSQPAQHKPTGYDLPKGLLRNAVLSTVGGIPQEVSAPALAEIAALPNWAKQALASGDKGILDKLGPVGSAIGKGLDAYNSVNVDVPGVTPLMEDVVKPAVKYFADRGPTGAFTAPLDAGLKAAGLPQTPKVNPTNIALNAVGLPSMGEIVSSMVPTKSADLALEALPAAGKLAEIAGPEVAARLAASERVNRALGSADVLTEQRAGAALARATGRDPLLGARTRVALAGASDETANPLDAIRTKFLTAAKEEENLRKVGTVQREIRQGRSAQAQGIMGGIRDGMTLEEAAVAAREGASQGGSLRKTFTNRIDFTPEEQSQIVGELAKQVEKGDITPFDYLRMVMPGDAGSPGIIAKLSSDTPKLQPNEIGLIRKVFGDEFANAAANRSARSADAIMTPAQERKLMEQASAAEAKIVERAQRDATRAEQRATLTAAKAQETRDARDLREALQAEQRRQRAFDKADRLEAEYARRVEQETIDKAQREAVAAEQKANEAFRKAAVEADIAAKAQTVAGDTKGETNFLQAATKSEMRADEAAATGRMGVAQRLREQALASRANADKLVFEATQREIDQEAARFAKTATKEMQADVESVRKLREAADIESPSPEMILNRARGVVGDVLSGMNQSPIGAHADNALAVIDYWLKGNRQILDNMKDAEGLNQVYQSIRAVATGDLADSYLTALMRRNHALGSALIESGMDPKVARQVADTMQQFELKQRFPKGVPERVTNELATMKNAPYQESLSGITQLVQRWKNTVYSLDAGVFGTQLLASIRRGGVQMMAGVVNDTLAALHLPNVETHMADVAMSKKVRNILDGVHVGLSRSGVDPEAGTLLSYIPGLKRLDPAISRRLEQASNVQFNTVMGWASDNVYEGQLVIQHLLGRDISNPAVRAAAAEAANSVSSFANTALRSRRAGLERNLLTSAPMTRAGMANILQMSKVFRPGATADERIVGATLIASQAAFMMVVGKFINDRVGITDFQFDPSKPGFGQIITSAKDAQGRNRILDLFPQASVEKAIARSFRELSQGNGTEAADAWLRYFSGRSSVVGRLLSGTAGVGYANTPNGPQYVGLNSSRGPLTTKERLLNLAPIPPIVQNVGSQVADGRPDPVESLSTFFGANTYAESTSGLRDREAQDRFGQPYNDLLPSQQKQINELPNVQSSSEARQQSDYQKAKEATYAPIQAKQDQAEEAFRKGELTQPLPDLWHDLGIRRDQARTDLAREFTKTFSKFDKNQFDKAVDGYYAIDKRNSDGTVNWDATEAARLEYMKAQDPKTQTWLNDFLDTNKQNQSPLRQAYLKYIDEREKAGYFKDGITTAELQALDRQNPSQDVLNWYWKGGVKDKNPPTLQSAEAVNQALAMGLPNRPVTFGGLSRSINQSPQIQQLWKDQGVRIANYLDDEKIAQKFGDRAATELYSKDGEVVRYSSLKPGDQATVRARIRAGLRESSPTLTALLAYMGDNIRNGEIVIPRSEEVTSALKQIRAKYGNEPPKAGVRYVYAKE